MHPITERRWTNPVRVDRECSMCRRCETECPTLAFDADTGLSNPATCIGCMHCVYTCPDKVVTVDAMKTTYEAFLARVHPEDREKVAQAWTAAQRGAPYKVEHRIVVDGTLKWVREMAKVEFDPSGQPVEGIGTVQDITARRQAEEQLRQSAAELRDANHSLQESRKAALNVIEDALQARQAAEAASAEMRSAAEQRRLALEAADLGSWDYHFQTGEVFWDERCREMWGMEQFDQTNYATAISRIHPEDRAGVDKAVQEALAGRDGGGYHREFRVVWPDGSVHWIASHGRVYFEGEDAQRHPIRFAGANREITVEKEAQEALRQLP